MPCPSVKAKYPCQKWVRIPTPQNVTVLMLNNGSPTPGARAAGQTAQLQMPGKPNLQVNATVLALVDTAFAPVTTNHTVTTDSQGFFEIPLADDTRYFQITIQMRAGGESIVINCMSQPGIEKIWKDDLTLRAALLRANRFAIDTSAFDHQGPPAGFGEQIGPCKAARAMAIVHAAIFEALNSIHTITPSHFGVATQPATASREAAIAQALHDTLVYLFPQQNSNTPRIANELVADLLTISPGPSRNQGIAAGSAAAAAVIAARANDGSAAVAAEESWVDFRNRVYNVASDNDVHVPLWKVDPVVYKNVALGSRWATVAPFIMNSAHQFRAPEPTAFTSHKFAVEMQETMSLGGDGTTTPTVRSEDATEIAIYYGYDASSLCAPSRLYNQMAVQIVTENGLPTADFARFLAILNIGMADAGIAAWDTKYYYNFARPVTMIREIGSQNPEIVANPTFRPLGAPAVAPHFTPPFPAYVSGHATFGGTLCQVLRRFLGSDDIPFTFISDEYNGHTIPPGGTEPRPLRPRSYERLSQSDEENGQSRIYLGVHWNCDKVEGSKMGHRVADWTVDHLYLV